MATEEQTQYNSITGMDGSDKTRVGQRLIISNRIVSKLSFPLSKINSPTGVVSFGILKQSDKSVIVSKSWGDASSLPVYPSVSWKEVTFDTVAYVDEEVMVCVIFEGGDGSNQVIFHFQNTDVKADEYWARFRVGSGWVYDVDEDSPYIYTYTTGIAPTVTTQDCSGVTAETAIGNGNITSLGNTDVTQHGHCWSTSVNPTTSDDKATKGSAPNTGSFTSGITELIVSTLYHVRAYATNSTGPSYGADVTITTSSTISNRNWWVEGLDFRYFDEFGEPRKARGSRVNDDTTILQHLYR